MVLFSCSIKKTPSKNPTKPPQKTSNQKINKLKTPTKITPDYLGFKSFKDPNEQVNKNRFYAYSLYALAFEIIIKTEKSILSFSLPVSRHSNPKCELAFKYIYHSMIATEHR